MTTKLNFDWPGWRLSANPFGKDFDLAARKRMVKSSFMLAKILKKYKRERAAVLEVGPFFNPLVTPTTFPNCDIFYYENDVHALKWLQKKFGKTTHPVYLDTELIDKERKQLFDFVVVSQVFNYIDYKKFIRSIKCFLRKGSLIFINNVIDYGLPILFSQKRPKSIREMVGAFKKEEYEIIEKTVMNFPNKRYQKNKHLLLVARPTK